MPQPRTIGARVRAILLGALAAATALAAVLALAACGGKSPSAAASEQANERNAEARFAEFAKCLREHGVNASTGPEPGGQGVGIRVQGTRGSAKGPQQMEAAQRACKRFQPPEQKVHLSPQEQVAHEEAVRKFATCMRAHGIDVHASAAGGGIQVSIRAKPGSGGPNPESPAFQAAQTACRSLLPLKGAPPLGASRTGGPGKAPSSGGEGGAGASSSG